MIGQPFAAGGALQVVASCFSLAEQFVPPTMNHDIPAPECDLDYVPVPGPPRAGEPRPRDLARDRPHSLGGHPRPRG